MGPTDYQQHQQQSIPRMSDVGAQLGSGGIATSQAPKAATISVLESMYSALQRNNQLLNNHLDSITNSLERIGVPHPQDAGNVAPPTSAPDGPGVLSQLADELRTMERQVDVARYLARRLELL